MGTFRFEILRVLAESTAVVPWSHYSALPNRFPYRTEGTRPAAVGLAVLVVLVTVIGTWPAPAPAQESIPEAVHRMDGALREMDRRLREAEQESRELSRRVLELERAVAAAAAKPAGGEAALAVELERDARVKVQRGLASLGFSPGPADGDFGPRTRAAVEAWQEAKGYQATGALTRAQADALVAVGEKAGGSVPGQMRPGRRFRDCTGCPEMVVVPAGSFMMGSRSAEIGRSGDEGPRHRVRIGKPFAVGVHEVTFAQWDACRQGGGCSHNPPDRSWGRGKRPVIKVSWNDAQQYVRWLSETTGQGYRLLSESEWEYAARAGTKTPFHTGVTISTTQANYDGRHTYGSGRKGRYRQQTMQVGSFAPNAFGLHDVHGNVSEWVEDCWHGSYTGAPADGSAWVRGGNCARRILRGGSWISRPKDLRSANRSMYSAGSRFISAGFRVARTLY